MVMLERCTLFWRKRIGGREGRVEGGVGSMSNTSGRNAMGWGIGGGGGGAGRVFGEICNGVGAVMNSSQQAAPGAGLGPCPSRPMASGTVHCFDSFVS